MAVVGRSLTHASLVCPPALKVHTTYLRLSLRNHDVASLLSIRAMIHLVFDQCVASIGNPIQIRAANAMLTLGILLQEVFAKQGYENFSYDVVELVVGCVCPPSRIHARTRARTPVP